MDQLGKRFWWQTVGLIVGLGVLLLISVLVFDRLAYRFGAFAAFLILFAVGMVVAYRHDKKKQREYEELP